MYHFKTNFGAKYTLLKLEGYYSISIGHSVAAIKRYKLKKPGKTAYETRREDCSKDTKGCKIKNKEETCYERSYGTNLCSVSINDYHNNKFYNNLNEENEKEKFFLSLNQYDTYVRTGDEFFIPQQITDYLLTNFNKHNNNL